MKTKSEKKQEAEDRQVKYNSMSLSQKLERAKTGGGKKGIEKLTKQLDTTTKG